MHPKPQTEDFFGFEERGLMFGSFFGEPKKDPPFPEI